MFLQQTTRRNVARLADLLEVTVTSSWQRSVRAAASDIAALCWHFARSTARQVLPRPRPVTSSTTLETTRLTATVPGVGRSSWRGLTEQSPVTCGQSSPRSRRELETHRGGSGGLTRCRRGTYRLDVQRCRGIGLRSGLTRKCYTFHSTRPTPSPIVMSLRARWVVRNLS